MKILHLIDSLDYSGSARQIHLLAPALADPGTSVEICCLGSHTPWSTSLRQSGVRVDAIGWTRWIDLCALWNLRDRLRNSSPDVIHVWRLPALRTLGIVAREMLSRVVMSAPLPARGTLGWWDRHLLRQVRCVAVAGHSDLDHCARQGVVPPSHSVVPPALEKRNPTLSSAKKQAPFSILCVGNLERGEGFRQAIWAFDFVRLLYPQAQLHLIGAGSQLQSLRALSEGLDSSAAVHFLGAQTDVSNALLGADIVWIPSLANCGRQVALEAMAQGRAVVASDVPCLRELVRDGETGYLVSRSDILQLARCTTMLFQDEQRRQRIGENAQQYVEQHFPLAEAVAHWRDLYRGIAA